MVVKPGYLRKDDYPEDGGRKFLRNVNISNITRRINRVGQYLNLRRRENLRSQNPA